MSPWLHPELVTLGLPVICLETQHVRAAMSAQQQDRREGCARHRPHHAHGWFRAAHVKTESCYRMRLLLTHQRNLKRKFLDLENAVRHSPKSFGIKFGGASRGKFGQAVRAAVADDPLSAELMDAMLSARATLWKEYCRLGHPNRYRHCLRPRRALPVRQPRASLNESVSDCAGYH